MRAGSDEDDARGGGLAVAVEAEEWEDAEPSVEEGADVLVRGQVDAHVGLSGVVEVLDAGDGV